MPVTILLADDSALIRGLIAGALGNHPGITVAGQASDGSMAVALAGKLQPDVILLDIEMPVMDGLTALPELRRVSPRSKIIMASNLTRRNAAISLQALALGASDYLAKPSGAPGDDAAHFFHELTQKILGLTAPPPRATSAAILPREGEMLNPEGIQALAVAASTGGPQALTQLFSDLKGSLAAIPIFITQHMPPTFTLILAEQLSRVGARDCREGQDGERVQPGVTYIAPGNYHMLVERNAGGQPVIRTNQEPHENFCRPAADPMLRSLSRAYGRHLAAVILTGMGHDGAQGAAEVVRAGGSVTAQDEASCMVYGMPKTVVEQGLCKAVVPLEGMAAFLKCQIDGQVGGAG